MKKDKRKLEKKKKGGKVIKKKKSVKISSVTVKNKNIQHSGGVCKGGCSGGGGGSSSTSSGGSTFVTITPPDLTRGAPFQTPAEQKEATVLTPSTKVNIHTPSVSAFTPGIRSFKPTLIKPEQRGATPSSRSSSRGSSVMAYTPPPKQVPVVNLKSESKTPRSSPMSMNEAKTPVPSQSNSRSGFMSINEAKSSRPATATGYMSMNEAKTPVASRPATANNFLGVNEAKPSRSNSRSGFMSINEAKSVRGAPGPGRKFSPTIADYKVPALLTLPPNQRPISALSDRSLTPSNGQNPNTFQFLTNGDNGMDNLGDDINPATVFVQQIKAPSPSTLATGVVSNTPSGGLLQQQTSASGNLNPNPQFNNSPYGAGIADDVEEQLARGRYKPHLILESAYKAKEQQAKEQRMVPFDSARERHLHIGLKRYHAEQGRGATPTSYDGRAYMQPLRTESPADSVDSFVSL